MTPVTVNAGRFILIVATLFAPGACKRPAHDALHTQSRATTEYPRAADRFILLVRKQLDDSDPVRVEQEMMCEGERMSRALGARQAAARISGALDTAYPYHEDTIALQRIAKALAGRVLGTGDHVCDSLIAAADRIDPIVPVRQPAPP